MKRVFLCGFSVAIVAGCTTAQVEQAQKDIALAASDVAAVAPIAGMFAPFEASAPLAASAPSTVASGVTAQ